MGARLRFVRRRTGSALAVVAGCGLALYATQSWWVPALGRSLACEQTPAPASTLVLDNFDNAYGLFRRGAELQRAGAASRVLIPVTASDEPDALLVAQEVTSAFARLAGLTNWRVVPIREQEPISLNAALEIRGVLLRERIASITLVSSGFRSRRSELIYRAVLEDTAVVMTCLPVFGNVNPDTWTATWHGIQDVALQFVKLQYYRFWVLPWAHRSATA